jgi:uncharacterized membrane protein
VITTQLLTVLIIALIVVVISFFWLKKEHMDDRVVATRVGAGLYGLIFGAFVGFVMVPLRFQLIESGAEDTGLLWKYIPAFAFFILVIRSDVTGRLPVIGTYIWAYRAALLRRNIEHAEKRLNKIATLEARIAGV